MIKIEGKNSIHEAINANIAVEKVFVLNTLKGKDNEMLIEKIKNKKIKTHFVDHNFITQESTTGRHQGFIAYIPDFKYSTVEDILKVAKLENKPNFILVLDEITDPQNFGAIIRVAECLGVHGIIIGKNRACPVTETVIKTSAGAINYVKIAKVTNINTEIERLKKENIWVYACELGGSDLNNADLSGNIAIVMGSEGLGVSALTKKLSDGIITIPMKGEINSLNVSVATGIVCYMASLKR